MKWLLVLVLVLLCTAGCVRRDGRNSDCLWPGEPGAKTLDINRASDARHLSADTEFAEELADRYTNVHYGPHSGYSGPPIAGLERHQCMGRMFDEIAKTHGVSKDVVIASYGHHRLGIDIGEILSFAMVYALAALLAVRWLWRRYPAVEGWAAPIIMLILGSVAFGVGASLVGPLWSATAENFRIGTGHLGPRMLRLPMERHQGVVLLIAMVVFWVVAVSARPAVDHQSDAAQA